MSSKLRAGERQKVVSSGTNLDAIFQSLVNTVINRIVIFAAERSTDSSHSFVDKLYSQKTICMFSKMSHDSVRYFGNWWL